jgi:(2Fe-2S) ferredoxin
MLYYPDVMLISDVVVNVEWFQDVEDEERDCIVEEHIKKTHSIGRSNHAGLA